LITTDAAAFHEPHTLGKPMELLGNAFLTCMITSAERVNHGRYSMLKLLGIKAASVNFVGINWPGMTVRHRH
jgi:hypothetical protein